MKYKNFIKNLESIVQPQEKVKELDAILLYICTQMATVISIV